MPNRSPRIRPSILALALLPAPSLAAVACADPGSSIPRASRADSAGVEIVVNTDEDRPLAWRAELRFRLGGADDGPEAFYRTGAPNIQTDERGRIYVLDRGNFRVVVFDSLGTHVRSVGREGGGPGELGFPLNLAVSPGGAVSVLDISKLSLVRFAPDGTLAEPQRATLQFSGGRIVILRSGLLTAAIDRDPALDDLVERLLVVQEADTVELTRISQPMPRPAEFRSCGITLAGIEPIFAPSIVWTARGTDVLVNQQPGYAVDRYRENRIVMSVRRTILPRPTTRSLALAELGEGMRFGGSGGTLVCEPDEVVEQRGFAEFVPVISELAAAPTGEMWVRRRAVGEETSPIDVFSSDGEYRGTLPADFPYPAAFLPNGDLVVRETNELDMEFISVYRLVRD